MVIPKINSAHGPDTRNILNRAIDLINVQGKTIQDLVAEGQLTPDQYATLIQTINGLIKSGEISINDIDKNNFKIDQTMIAESLLKQIAGTAEINAVPADNSITTQKMADKSVTPDKTTMFNSDNLFDLDEVQIGKTLDTDGTVITDSNRWLSGFIPVSPSETLSLTAGSYRTLFYNQDKAPIGNTGGTSTSPYTTSTDATTSYMRISGVLSSNPPENVMINKGTTLKEYVEYGMLKRKHIPDIQDDYIEPKMISFINPSSNLFDRENTIPHTSIVDDVIVDDSSRWLSNFIPCEMNEVFSITAGQYRLFYYDSEMELRVTTGVNTRETEQLTISNDRNIKYFRLSGSMSNELNEMVVNRGKDLKEWSEYRENLVDKEYIPFITKSKNLFDRRKVQEKTSLLNGEIVDDPLRWLSGFFEGTIGEVFSLTGGAYRIIYYDEKKDIVVESGINTIETERFTVTSDNSIRYFRLSSSMNNNYNKVVLNKGYNLYEWDEYGTYEFDSNVINNVGTSFGGDFESEVFRLMDHPAPSIPSLNFTTVRTGWEYIKELSRDGEIVFGSVGLQLLQSKDEFETVEEIGQAIPSPTNNGIAAVRELYDGELIVSVQRNEDENARAKLYKTVGYDRNNPSATTFKEVLESNVTQANFQNNWGLSVYNNIVLASEYGLNGVEGARFVYLSENHGDTFTPIFDQMTTTAEIENAPEWTTTGHIHTVEYDPYWNRIWLVVGDHPNTATYFSDDKGQSWTFVKGSTEVQYTGIKALPDIVIFGSDRNPNGVHHFVRKNKSDMPVIKPLLLLNDLDYITHVFQKAYKRGWDPDVPTYFATTGNDSRGAKSKIVGTVNGKKAYVLWESGNNYTGNISTALGNTVQGNILAEVHDDTVVGRRIVKAKAPEWK